ncbi:MAG: hypothetical protein JWN66_3913 [Sphingomonas bacterium]|uniref:hypothetical protein n=1 Tax=Sphingomonas bacterium TaxID=1895847 RepID=UPI00261CA745|nr:hypothetical protein [Sphingomonas bacterium]MDB5706797.1 hypothetical protein [Sphingomonas bacterium]
MKHVPMRSAFCLVLACAAPAAMAQKPAKPPAEHEFKLAKPVRAAVADAQKAIKAGDLATATAKLAEADAAVASPDDSYVIASARYELATAQKDMPARQKALEVMLDSGLVPPASLTNYSLAAGQLAYNNKDMAKAAQFLGQATAGGVTDANAFAMLMEAYIALNKPAEAVATLEKAIALQPPGSTAIPADWYGRAIGAAYNAKLAPETERITRARVAAYPSPTNWRDALISYRDLNQLDPQAELDVMRLLRVAKGLKGGRDYLDVIEPTAQKFPGEARSALDEGLASGALQSSSATVKELDTTIKARFAGDRASLPSSAASAKTANGGMLALGTADAYFGYGDYAPAIELYHLALAKGGVDANVVNTRLGASLALSGQADEAKKTFAAVTGPRAGLAKYWLVWVGQPK